MSEASMNDSTLEFLMDSSILEDISDLGSDPLAPITEEEMRRGEILRQPVELLDEDAPNHQPTGLDPINIDHVHGCIDGPMVDGWS